MLSLLPCVGWGSWPDLPPSSAGGVTTQLAKGLPAIWSALVWGICEVSVGDVTI